MKLAGRLLWMLLWLGVASWAQSGPGQAPKSRRAHPAGVHKMPRHAARQLTIREEQEHARMRAEQRRQAKLAKKQRKQAMRRSHRTRNAGMKSQ